MVRQSPENEKDEEETLDSSVNIGKKVPSKKKSRKAAKENMKKGGQTTEESKSRSKAKLKMAFKRDKKKVKTTDSKPGDSKDQLETEAEEEIPTDKSEASKVKVFGAALEKVVPAMNETYVIIDCKEAGKEKPEVKLVTENDEQEVPFSMVDFKNDTYKVDFTPQTSLKVYVTYLDKPVSDSPFQVEVSSALDRQLSVYGPAIEEPVEVFNTTQFMIDSTRVNYIFPEIKMVDEVTYEAIPFRVNGYNGRFRVELLPVEANPILLYVNSNEYPIESSPFKITVQNPSPPKISIRVCARCDWMRKDKNQLCCRQMHMLAQPSCGASSACACLKQKDNCKLNSLQNIKSKKTGPIFSNSQASTSSAFSRTCV